MYFCYHSLTLKNKIWNESWEHFFLCKTFTRWMYLKVSHNNYYIINNTWFCSGITQHCILVYGNIVHCFVYMAARRFLLTGWFAVGSVFHPQSSALGQLVSDSCWEDQISVGVCHSARRTFWLQSWKRSFKWINLSFRRDVRTVWLLK